MPDPGLALAVFAGLAFLTGILFWPVSGVVPRIRRLIRLTDRVKLEDVLKQLYKLEYNRLPATAESVAGGVQIPRQEALRLLQRLEERDFVDGSDETFALTEDGRTYALRIIRTHRLWERFLADRTGTRPEDWHRQAEAREHMLSETETEGLAAALGQPLYDPHGDPIPTASGELPARSGVPLSTLRPGDTAVITHLEDEPPPVYRELVSLGLGPMVPVERLAGPKGRVRFRALGVEHDIQGVVARNVTVQPAATAPTDPWTLTLAALEPGESAAVLGISPTCQGPARRRLLDLGVVPGTVIQARMWSAGGDPMAYEIRGALIALRREQADLIQVERAPVEVVAS